VIQERLEALVMPAVNGQMDYYRQMGHRNRILGLVVMVVAILMLIWRQVPSVCELAKMVAREDLFWIMRFGTTWYRYVTSVLDPAVLPADVVADLYRRRWRIEEAFFVVKRLLNLSYLWMGSVNGVLLQVWSTWLFFAVLIDLGDAVAEELMLPFDQISLEMVFRGIYRLRKKFDSPPTQLSEGFAGA
jgi:hypothetical protein